MTFSWYSFHTNMFCAWYKFQKKFRYHFKSFWLHGFFCTLMMVPFELILTDFWLPRVTLDIEEQTVSIVVGGRFGVDPSPLTWTGGREDAVTSSFLWSWSVQFMNREWNRSDYHEWTRCDQLAWDTFSWTILSTVSVQVMPDIPKQVLDAKYFWWLNQSFFK